MKKRVKIDLILLLIYPLFGFLLSHLLKINFFSSVIVFFGVPSAYLTFRAIKYSKKAVLFSFFSVPIMISLDYVAQRNEQWVTPGSIFSFRLFETVTVEVLFWIMLQFYFVVLFYKYFIESSVTKKLWGENTKYLLSGVVFSFILFLIIYFYSPTTLDIPYFFIWCDLILGLIPLITCVITHKRLNPNYLKAGAYFFYVSFVYEIAALQLGWWSYPYSSFIGWMPVFNIKFPLEELIWMFLFAIAILIYYKFFFGDNSKRQK